MGKSSRPTGAKAVTCTKCGTQAHGIPDTIHRWCRGSKKDRKASVKGNRGSWQ